MADSASNAGEAKPENHGAGDQPAEKAEEAAPPTPKEMRAVVLTGFGGLKSVKVMKKPEPSVGEGEVLLRVKACGMNFLDLMLRQGAIDSPHKTPFILGFECAGEVEAAGSNVTTFQPGDKVVALCEYKAWAELVVVPTKYVYKIPVGMSFQDAAALVMNFVVAYVLLFEIGGLQKGKTVLIHSAGGGVGQAVAQLCKLHEDVTVYGVCSQSKHEAISESFSKLFDRTQDYVQEVKKVAAEGVDLVLDCLCGEDCSRGYNLLKPMGKYILYGSANLVTGETKSVFSLPKFWWQVDKVNPVKLFDENKCIAGFNLRHLMFQQGHHDYVRSIVEKVFKLWQEGKIKPVIDSTCAFEDVPEAMQKMHDRKNIGKITLDPYKEPKPKPQGKGNKEGKEKDKEMKAENKTLSTESAEGEEPKPAEEAATPQETK